MLKRFCDRCDAEVNFGKHVIAKIDIDGNDGGAVSDKKLELCQRCAAELRDFLQPLPKCAGAC